MVERMVDRQRVVKADRVSPLLLVILTLLTVAPWMQASMPLLLSDPLTRLASIFPQGPL